MLDLVVELLDSFLPFQIEKIHLGQMGVFELSKFFLMLVFVLSHLPVLQLLLQSFHLTLKCLCFDILSFGLALFLFSNGLLSGLEGVYMLSQSWFTSRFLYSTLSFCDLGEVMVFLAVGGL